MMKPIQASHSAPRHRGAATLLALGIAALLPGCALQTPLRSPKAGDTVRDELLAARSGTPARAAGSAVRIRAAGRRCPDRKSVV